jgi:DedD protein
MEKSALRQRLIGAAVLIAAGVIFIPWLLDDEQARSRLSDSVIPPQPDLQIQVIEFNPSARGTLPAPRPPRELPPEIAEVKAPPPEPKAETPVKVEPKPEASQPVVTESKPAVAPKPLVPMLTESSEVKGWVVQVASFTEGRVERASNLLDALKKKGYRAVAEKVEVRGTTYYRISVMGLANESIAKRASKAIDEAFKAERIESQVKQR